MIWMQRNKRADFSAIGRRFGIDPVTARIIRNRDVIGEEAVRLYLYGGLSDLCDPHLLPDADRLTEILRQKIHEKKPIRVIGDYDIDGVMSAYILATALRRCGADVSVRIPHRILDGYGLNIRLVEEAFRDGVDTILTCDNGIAASEEIAHAADLGMTVLVSDHHEVPYEEQNGTRIYGKSRAQAVVDPHRPDSRYPYPGLCGAAVAWKIVCLLYAAEGIKGVDGTKIGGVPKEAEEFLEEVAFATVGDIMSLTGENRILVREGLSRIAHTKNVGMRALIAACGLTPEQISAYHFGYVLGPCINAAGRLDSADRALALFMETDERRAQRIADELVSLNAQRKEMTEEGTKEALALCEEGGYVSDPVLVLYLPDLSESISGIVAGRVRERYYKPTFVLTKTKEGEKGSGRSVPEYSMYEQINRCADLFLRFGGHPMAAGFTLKAGCVEEFRRRLNEDCPQEARNAEEKVYIDVPMPTSYPTLDLVREFSLLEPFGKDNESPLFAEKGLFVRRLKKMGEKGNALRLWLRPQSGRTVTAVYFGDVDAVDRYLTKQFGEEALTAAYRGADNPICISILYELRIHVYEGREEMQIQIRDYR